MYRWDGITDDHFHCQRLSLPELYRLYSLSTMAGSSRTFLVENDGLWHEVDMRDISIPALPSDENAIRVELIGDQVSGDGYHFGMVYRVEEECSPKASKVMVQINDLRRTTNQVKFVKVTPRDPDRVHSPKLNSDLSMLCIDGDLYDLSSATVDIMAMATPFSGHISSSRVEILFSPDNQFLCSIGSDGFRIFQICRSTETIVELCVGGAKFSDLLLGSDSLRVRGVFHPHRPILVLYAKGNSGWEVIEVNLSSLEAISLQAPQFP